MKKAIGVLGGMGPEASVYLYKTLIELSISEFGAANNSEFPEIILDSVPVPDFISSDKDKLKANKMLQIRVKQLSLMPLACFGIACNTAHMLLPDLQAMTSVPFVSMIDAVVNEVKKNKLQKVGILGTPSTLRSGLYHKALSKQGIKAVSPEEKEFPILERAIRNVIGGVTSKQDAKALRELANSLKEQGAEGIILGCTELPLVFPSNFTLPIYNSVTILARDLLRRYYKKATMGATL
ncbi:amino acid racemase [soil metagenome]